MRTSRTAEADRKFSQDARNVRRIDASRREAYDARRMTVFFKTLGDLGKASDPVCIQTDRRPWQRPMLSAN